MKTDIFLQQYIAEIATNSANCGKISLVEFEGQVRQYMKKIDCLKNLHHYDIWQNDSGMWITRVPDETRKEGSKKLSSKDKNRLVDKLLEHYGLAGITVDIIYQRWHEEKMQIASVEGAECRTSIQTLDRNDRAYKSYFGSFKNMDIKAVTEGDIEDFIMSLKKRNGKPISQGDFNIVKTLLRAIFTYARKRQLTDIKIQEALEDMELPAIARKKKGNDNSTESFNSFEEKMIIKYLINSGKMVDMALILDFVTGIRRGELAALEMSDVGGDDDSITVSKTEVSLQKDGHIVRFIQDYTKTEAGMRTVYLPDKDKWLLKKIKNMGDSDRKYLFEENGKRIYASHIYDRLKYVLKALQLKHRSTHKIRKTYAGKMFAAGLPAGFIQQQIGHEDIQTTLSIYVKPNYTEQEIKDFVNAV